MGADAWYPNAGEYWVDPVEQDRYPSRQGDVFPSEPGVTRDGWIGFVALSPSCEIQRKGVDIQVARLHRVSSLADEFQKTQVAYGFTIRDDGSARVAFAHTFWMPNAGDDGPLAEPLFVDFRDVVRVPADATTPDRRARAMTHDARLWFIRRKVFYRYRWNLSIDDVRVLEAERIRSDQAFRGPRPPWA